MTMVEFKKELVKTIPTPTTVQQKLLLEAVEEINEKLNKYGEVTIHRGSGNGNRTILLRIAKNLLKMYQDAGYKVSWYEYSEKNKYDYFWMNIEYRE